MKKKLRFAIFLPFLIAIPIIVVTTLEDRIIENHGIGTFNTLVAVMVVTIIIISFLPFVSIFKNMFGGGGYSLFWGHGKIANQILQTGKAGKATVKSIGENSGGGVMTINGQPVLNLVLLIETDSEPAYEVSFDTIISRASVPQFQPGAFFPVRIDSTNPQRVVLDSNAPNVPNKPVVGGKDWTDMDKELLQNEGKDGMAKILEVRDTGKTENFQPLVAILYEVYLAGESPYKIEKEIPLSTVDAKKLSKCIGKTYNARVHPYNKERMVIEITF